MDVISSYGSNLFIEQLRELYRCGHAVTESEVVSKNGICMPVEMSMSFIEYRGKPAILAIIRDVRDRKKAEQMLKYERDRAQNYLDIAETVIIAVNAGQKITLINKKGSELLGYPKKDILGKNWFDTFIPEKRRQEIKGIYLQLLSGNLEPFEHFETPVLTRSGEERIIRWHNSILKDNESRIVGILSSGEDITEYKKSEEEMRVRSVAMDSSLTAIIIANPAGYITYVNSAFVKLWAFSDEKEVLGKSVRSLGASGETAARIKFKQILYNLIDNAIKFSPENGLIEICTDVLGDKVSISVTDSGRGISIADQRKLFEPFTQLDRFESREQPGTGLGLVIVKKFVEMHGGKVKVESRIGEGSKFSFTIPLARE